jgi:hypothetical protein
MSARRYKASVRTKVRLASHTHQAEDPIGSHERNPEMRLRDGIENSLVALDSTVIGYLLLHPDHSAKRKDKFGPPGAAVGNSAGGF